MNSPQSRARAVTQPSIASPGPTQLLSRLSSRERATSSIGVPVYQEPPVYQSPLTPTRGSGELVRRAMHLKQERSEISDQLRMIETRLRLRADVLFADEQDSLNEQKCKLVESDEAKRQLLEELQSQFQLVSTEETMDAGLDLVWNESSDSSEEPELSPTNHTIHQLLQSQAPRLDWGSEEEQSPRSRRRSLQLRRMEEAEHRASSQLQAALNGLQTRVTVSHAHHKRQTAAHQLVAAVRGGVYRRQATVCSNVVQQLQAQLYQFCRNVQSAGMSLEPAEHAETVLLDLESTLQQCAQLALRADSAAALPIAPQSVQVFANVYVRRALTTGGSVVVDQQSMRQRLHHLQQSLEHTQQAQELLESQHERLLQQKRTADTKCASLATKCARMENKIRELLETHQQQDRSKQQNQATETVEAQLRQQLSQQQSEQLDAQEGYELQLSQLQQQNTELKEERVLTLSTAVEPLMKRITDYESQIKDLEDQLEVQNADNEAIEAAWEMMTGKPYGVE